MAEPTHITERIDYVVRNDPDRAIKHIRELQAEETRLNQRIRQLEAQQADTVAVSQEVIDFLHGVGELDGKRFGDTVEVCGGKYLARYWWRKYLPPFTPQEVAQ